MWQKVAKFKGAEYFRKALYTHTVGRTRTADFAGFPTYKACKTSTCFVGKPAKSAVYQILVLPTVFTNTNKEMLQELSTLINIGTTSEAL